MMDSKPWWASKTLWTNFVAVVAAVAVGFGFDFGVDAQAELVVGVMAVVNLALRFATKTGIRSA